MFPLPIKFYIYSALIACATGGILYGNHEADKYNTFKAEVEAVAKEQEAHNQEIAKQGELINQQIKVDYEKQIANIRNVYARRVFIDTNSGEVSSVPNPSSGANETSPDPEPVPPPIPAVTNTRSESLTIAMISSRVSSAARHPI